MGERSESRENERAAKPRGAEEIGELARWLGKVRRLARLHALLLPAPYNFSCVFYAYYTGNNVLKSYNYFLPDSTHYKANNILNTFLVMQRRGTIVF